LRAELALARDARSLLSRISDRAFAEQAAPFIDAAADSANAGIVGATLLQAERPSLSADRTMRGGLIVHVAPPVPAQAAMLRDLLARWRAHLSSLRRLVYGWRPVNGLARPSYAPRNVLDTFLDEVDRRDADWQPLAGQAASGVTLTVDGRPAPAPVAGAVGLSGRNCGRLVVARDAAGGQTSMRLPPCRRR
jgi:hypothetical protein